jgi:hypothetical protein
MEYGIIFLGKSPYSKEVLQIRITKCSQTRASCKAVFRKLDILTIPSQQILSVMMFIVSNKAFKSSISKINTREGKTA